MVEKYTLKNGIPVFIVQSHYAPVVSIQAWFSRGSVYEPDKLAGISHFLEHSLFKGTKKRKVGEIALEIERRGGEINAFTSFEETVYYCTLGSRHFDEGFDIIADAIQHPTFDAQEMIREREVILEEIRRANDSSGRIVSFNLWKSVFPSNPYGRPVLGFESTVSKIDHKTLRAYFEKQYHSGSLAMVIVGDVDPKEVLKVAEAKLGKMKLKKQTSIPQVPQYMKINKPRLTLVGRDVTDCQMQLAWPSPALSDERIPALDLMCTAIGHGESAPLYQHLVKDTQHALDINMGLAATARCGMATVGLETSTENFYSALKETMALLQAVAVRGITAKEIERVKTSLEAEVVAGKETVEGYARRLGYYYVQFGDPDYEKKYLDSLLAVTPEQATEALRWMLKTKPVLSVVHPQSAEFDQKRITEILSVELPKIKPVSTVTSPESVQIEKRGTIRYLEKKITHLPTVSVRILFPGGNREEAPDKLGISTLFHRIWTSGTTHFRSRDIAHGLESIGASVHAFSGKHSFGLTLEFLTKHWPAVKPIFSEVLLEPIFPLDEFETEKKLLIQDIKSERDVPSQLCHMGYLTGLYGDHPYGRSGYGKIETVSSLRPEDLKTLYRNYIHQKGAVVCSVGAFEKETWQSELHEIFSKLPKDGKNPTPALKVRDISQTHVFMETKQPLFQSHIMIGFHGAGLHNHDRFALKLLSSCLAGQGGRLFLELRDKQSLAYSVSPMNSENVEMGSFGVYIGCAPEKWHTAIRGIRNELEKVVAKPLGAKELQRAKEYWTGRYELELQRYGAQASTYAVDEIFGLGYNYSEKIAERVRSVTAEEIRAAAEKYLTFDRAIISIVHPETLSTEKILSAWTDRLVIAAPKSSGERTKSLAS